MGKRGGGGRYKGSSRDDGYYYSGAKGNKEDAYFDNKGKKDGKRKSESEGKSSDDRSEKESSDKYKTDSVQITKESAEVPKEHDNKKRLIQKLTNRTSLG